MGDRYEMKQAKLLYTNDEKETAMHGHDWPIRDEMKVRYIKTDRGATTAVARRGA
jgi:hypothetical protein